jgi:hypothetical protein
MFKSSSLARIGWLVAIALLLAALPGAAPARAAENTKTYGTVQDFTTTCTGGPQPNDTVVTEDSNGEIALRASLEDYFYTGPLDSGLWSTGAYDSGTPSFTVASGMVTITSSAAGGGYVRSQTNQHYGRLEAKVTFSNGKFQHFGWADPSFNYYIMFSTLNTTNQLFTRTQNGSGEITTLVEDPLTTSALTLAIEWTDGGGGNDTVRYYINGALVHTDTVLPFPANQLQIVLSNDTRASVQDLSADWIRYTPYAVTSGTYLSCPFSETGTPTLTWGPISWTASTPAVTSLAVEVQTSNNGSSWSSLVAVANNTVPNISDSRYIRFKLTLSTTDPNVTPKLEALSIKYRPQPTITIGNASLVEGNSGSTDLDFTVTLSEISYHDVTVQYTTANGTATAGSDYTATSGTLTIPASSLTGTISVPIIGNTIVEPDETFVVNLSNPTRASLADGQATGTITNDDSATITIGDASLVEGNSGTANMTFTVSLSNLSDSPVQVDYVTADDSATAGSDYTATSGILTIPAGDPSATISVPIKGDTTVEPDETFFVNLTNPTGATLADNQAVGTITNDDSATITIGDVSLAEGNSGTANMNFTVTLSNPSASVVQVDYATADNTASAGSDYIATSNTLTFPIGSTSQVISVPINGDTTVEPNEAFFVNLTNPSGATIADNQATGTITNDDNATISIGDVSQSEGDSGTANMTFTVSLSNPSASVVQVDYATANDSATAGSDYVAKSGTLSFPIGSTSQTVSVVINGDTTVEPNETFFVNLTNPSGATIADNQATGTITNDDSATIAISDVSQSEGDSGTANMTFTVSLSNPSASVVQVDYATANDSATAGSDYIAKNGTLSFPIGSTSQTISIVINGDTTVEQNEDFFINLSNPTGATIADNQATGTIINDDGPRFTIGNASTTEGDTGTRTISFAVSLVGSDGSPAQVDYATANDSATAGSDYVATSGTLSFPANTTAQTITITVKGDMLVEPDEAFFVNLDNASGATIADNQGVGTIVNDDSTAISISDASISEGNSGNKIATFTVSLSNPSASIVQVHYATANGTASAGSDYVAKSGTLSFPANTTVQTITVAVNGDLLVEGNEVFFVNLSNATGATIADNQGVGTIVDDDTSQQKIYLPLVVR